MNPQLLFLAILICFSAFFSASEIALFTLGSGKIRSLVERRMKNAHRVQALKSDPQRLLITILIGNNLANISASAMATALAIRAFGSYGVGIATGIMTFLILFFGEIVPKSFAQKHAEAFALRTAPVMQFIMVLFRPIIFILNTLTLGFQKLVGMHDGLRLVSEEEVRALVQQGHEEGTLERDEREMIEKVFLLNDIKVEDVMTPEEYVVGFDTGTRLREVLGVIKDSGYSRFPIYLKYDGSIEGILYTKDVFAGVIRAREAGNTTFLDTSVEDLAKSAMFIPENIHVDRLLHEFQRVRKHIAIVVDEHGTVRGIVTLEDVLEEIVGEIDDETDAHDRMLERLDEQTLLVDPRVRIGNMNTTMNIAFPGSPQKTIGWLVLKHFGRIPQKGDSIDIHGYKVIIDDAEEHRIKRLRVVTTAVARRKIQVAR